MSKVVYYKDELAAGRITPCRSDEVVGKYDVSGTYNRNERLEQDRTYEDVSDDRDTRYIDRSRDFSFGRE